LPHLRPAYTFVLAAAVRGGMLWFGGVAFFADLTTVGEWVGLLCAFAALLSCWRLLHR
jgi:hypothetical protein